MIDKHNVEIITNELLRLIPISFIMSKEFDSACSNSQYKMPWLIANVGFPKVDLIDVRTEDQKAEDNFISCCNTIYSNGYRTFYSFIVFVISQYNIQTHKKVDVKALRVAFREMGISDFSELNRYAMEFPLSILTEDGVMDWQDVKEGIKKLEADCYRAENTIDYQNIGNSCRTLLLKVATLVYDPKVHGETREDGQKISEADSMGMLANYFSCKLSGDESKKFRAYAKATNDLANGLTHKTTAKKQDMLIGLSATIHLIYIIGIIEDKLP